MLIISPRSAKGARFDQSRWKCGLGKMNPNCSLFLSFTETCSSPPSLLLPVAGRMSRLEQVWPVVWKAWVWWHPKACVPCPPRVWIILSTPSIGLASTLPWSCRCELSGCVADTNVLKKIHEEVPEIQAELQELFQQGKFSRQDTMPTRTLSLFLLLLGQSLPTPSSRLPNQGQRNSPHYSWSPQGHFWSDMMMRAGMT